MNPNPAARHRRATFVIAMLTLVAGAGVFFFSLLLFGTWFLAMLVTLVAVALFGWLHYLLWGRTLSREVAARPREPGGDGQAPSNRGMPRP